MTYPKVSHTDASRACPSSPTFPAIEEAVLAYWEADDTFQASVDQRDAGEDGDNEFVFYDGPPFANGLPHYGHLLTGYVKDLVPRYQTMRGRRVERRFGWDTHGLPAELEAMRQLGIKTKDEIVELGIEKFNAVPRVGAEVHRRVARLRHPPGPLGRLRQRLPDAQPGLHGVGDLGVQAALRQGPGLRGLPGAALLLERRDAAVQPRAADGRRRLPDPPGPGGHRRLPAHRRSTSWRRARAGLDDDAVDAAVQPGDRGRPRHRLRRGGVRRHRHDRALRARRGPAGGVRRASSPTRAPTARAWSSGYRAPTWSGRSYTPPFSYYAGHARRASGSSRADFVTTDGRHRASCTCAGASARTTRSSPTARASRRSCRSARTAVHLPGHRLRGHARLRRQPR